MLSTFRSKEDFLAAVSSRLDSQQASPDVRSALVAGISSADDTLRQNAKDSKGQTLNLKIGSWVIRDDDLPLFQALNTASAAIILSFTTGGLAWPAMGSALSSFANLCWQCWRKGARLSSLQVAVYGFLQTRGPLKPDAIFDHLKEKYSEPVSLDTVESTLESLQTLDLNGHTVALASPDNKGAWKALKI